jgi:nucleotide-binding universal stress UspA family protein
MGDENFRFGNHRILCVMGFNSNEVALVQHAEDMAQRTAADLVLLHVIPESSEALLHDAADGGSRPLSRDSAAARLDDLARTLRARSTTSVMVGEPRKCIGLAAARQPVDLVLVSRANGGLQATYGCNPSEILDNIHCPLLTIRG